MKPCEEEEEYPLPPELVNLIGFGTMSINARSGSHNQPTNPRRKRRK
jgi:hypothetical protein